jgi:hypothetical protein
VGSAAGSGGEEGLASADMRVDFAASDPAELGALSQWLEGGGRTRIERTPAGPARGELGAVDILAAVGSSGTLVAAIKVLPEFLRSRHPSLRIEATVKGERFVLEAKNADEQVMRMAERIVDTVLGD